VLWAPGQACVLEGVRENLEGVTSAVADFWRQIPWVGLREVSEAFAWPAGDKTDAHATLLCTV
jgi:hypothetical protein